ncbi:MAG: carboxypeptidase regulatory-like domain-containing protein [Terriglobia bacterium]
MRHISGLTVRTLIALAISAPGVFAQTSATISGNVTDATGSPLNGVTITVKSLETSAVRTAVTNDSGSYQISSLPLGPQQLEAKKTGFRGVIRTGINLNVGQEAEVNLQLDLGEIAQQITVSEDIPLIDTSTASSSGVVGSGEVKDLPLNGRSFDNLITLNPGAISYGLKSPQTSTSNGNTFTVAGRRPSDNLFLLNGIEYTGTSQLANTPGGVSGELLGIDAVREFNVLTDTYSAEYGKRSGAQVTVVTQSGGNVPHGSLFEFLRNNVLDARNFFDQGSAPPFRRNQFGGAVGGPIKKDRLFLFGNYEGFRQSLAVSNVSVVPNAQTRLGILPGVTANPAMLKYMAFWPLANGPDLGGGTALSYNNPRQHIHEDFATGRGDYIISQRDTLSAAYTIDDGNSLIPLADPLFGSYLTLRNQVASIQETHIFSPRVVNTFRAGFSRAGFNYDSFPLTTFDPSLDFVKGGGPGGIVIGGGATTTGIAAITSAGPNNAADVWNRRNLFTLTNNFEVERGNHQISAGFWIQRVQDNENTASRRLGQASFASLQTFLQGTVTTFQVVPSPTELGWRSIFAAWYVQDKIRLRHNVTLELGLRHEFTNGWNEVAGRASNYVTDSQGVLVTAPRVGNSVFTENNAKKLFGPRVALAWDVSGNGKTSVRAGFGTYYSLIDNLAFLINSLPPYNGAASYTGSLPSLLPITPGVQPLPACGPGVPAGTCTIFAPQGVQANAKTPTVQEWSLRIERQLDSNTALRLAYVGSFGYHGFVSVDPNTIPAQICTAPAGCRTGTVPQGAQYIPVGTRPNPYVSAGFFWYSEGNSSYNSLQADISRRFSRGLQFRGNFTWSKSLDNNSALTGAQGNNQAQMILDRNDLHRDWGPSALNAKFQSSLSVRYDLPMGFQINGIASLLSGFPFTPQVGSNRSADQDTRNPDRPSLNPAFSGPVILGAPSRYFDPNAFILPTAGTYGNLGRGAFYGPSLADIDLSLFKNFRLRERTDLQFRAECFNVVNHANFASPNPIVFTNGAISPSAGLITSTVTSSRQIQFGLKLIF